MSSHHSNKGWHDMKQHALRVAPDDQSLNLPPRTRDLCETVLAALGRDDKLRLAFLRRRWQGLSD